MRLAGTWKQYSKKAIIQLITITLNNGTSRYFRWPYQAKVMKILETVSRAMVRMECNSSGIGRFGDRVFWRLKILTHEGVAIARLPDRKTTQSRPDALSWLCVYNLLF